jgi:hypothetical protein
MPTRTIPVGAPVLDVQNVLAHLNASARAQVLWAAKPIELGLARLRKEPLTDALVAEVADAIGKPLEALTRAVWRSAGANLDEFRAATMQALETEELRLGRFLDDEGARETLAYVLGFVRSFYSFTFAHAGFLLAALEDDGVWASVHEDPGAKPLWRGYLALAAACEEARIGADAGRARELVDVSFLELTEFRAFAQRQGIWLTAFPSETLVERRERGTRAAERLRRTFTQDDWIAIEGARMRDLR